MLVSATLVGWLMKSVARSEGEAQYQFDRNTIELAIA
jgi:hypothetical protein